MSSSKGFIRGHDSVETSCLDGMGLALAFEFSAKLFQVISMLTDGLLSVVKPEVGTMLTA